MTTSDDLPEHVREALKGVLHENSDGITERVIQFHEQTFRDYDVTGIFQLAIVEINKGKAYKTRYYKLGPNSGTNFHRVSEKDAEYFNLMHHCIDDGPCYRRA